MANKRKSKREELIEYITSGWFGYAIEFCEDGTCQIVAKPDEGVDDIDDLIGFLVENDYKLYVGYEDEDEKGKKGKKGKEGKENKHDTIANNIDGEAVDLEVLQWRKRFFHTSRGNPCTPMTLACIPRHIIEQEGWSTKEEVAAVGDLAVFVAELRLIRELEPDESLDESLV